MNYYFFYGEYSPGGTPPTSLNGIIQSDNPIIDIIDVKKFIVKQIGHMEMKYIIIKAFNKI